MNFKELLDAAKKGNSIAKETILDMYKPLLMKESIIDGAFDEDLYQELREVLIKCIKNFKE